MSKEELHGAAELVLSFFHDDQSVYGKAAVVLARDYLASRPKKKTFARPTVEEVSAYCLERGNRVDPEAWMDHYASNGWKVGRTTMKDWKASVRQWERHDFVSSSNGTAKGKPGAGPGLWAAMRGETQ